MSGIWFGLFVYFHTLCVRTAKALARLRGCWSPMWHHNLLSWFLSSKRCKNVTKHKWAATWQNQLRCAPSEDSDQPGHPPSLIRVFAVCSMGSWGLKVSSCGQWRLWSDWADAQADLSLRWVHMSFCWFCHVAAQITSFWVQQYESYQCFSTQWGRWGYPGD